jgi:hypothetical protein
MRHKAIFAWLVIGPLKFVSTHKLGLPFTVLTVGLLRRFTSRSSNAGAPAGSKAWSGVQCCVDMTMPVAWLMTDRLDRALRRSRWPPLPQTPQGPGVQYVLAMLRPRGLRARSHTWRRLSGPAGGVLMRVVQFRACGGPEILKRGDDPDPRAGQRRIRVAVRAAGLNPVDRKTFAGTMSGGQRGDLREADRG